jgi:hypothetical protein
MDERMRFVIRLKDGDNTGSNPVGDAKLSRNLVFFQIAGIVPPSKLSYFNPARRLRNYS